MGAMCGGGGGASFLVLHEGRDVLRHMQRTWLLFVSLCTNIACTVVQFIIESCILRCCALSFSCQPPSVCSGAARHTAMAADHTAGRLGLYRVLFTTLLSTVL